MTDHKPPEKRLLELLLKIEAQFIRVENALEPMLEFESSRFAEIEKRLLALEKSAAKGAIR